MTGRDWAACFDLLILARQLLTSAHSMTGEFPAEFSTSPLDGLCCFVRAQFRLLWRGRRIDDNCPINVVDRWSVRHDDMAASVATTVAAATSVGARSSRNWNHGRHNHRRGRRLHYCHCRDLEDPMGIVRVRLISDGPTEIRINDCSGSPDVDDAVDASLHTVRERGSITVFRIDECVPNDTVSIYPSTFEGERARRDCGSQTRSHPFVGDCDSIAIIDRTHERAVMVPEDLLRLCVD